MQQHWQQQPPYQWLYQLYKFEAFKQQESRQKEFNIPFRSLLKDQEKIRPVDDFQQSGSVLWVAQVLWRWPEEQQPVKMYHLSPNVSE